MRKKIYYIRDSFRYKKISGLFGLARAYLTLKTKHRQAIKQPIFLLLEPTTNCTLQCKMCLRSNSKIKRGNLSFDNYIKIISQFDSLSNLCLTGLGEPFFNNEIFKMIEYAKKIKKISYVWISSNGQMLNKNICEEIIKSGLDSIYVSVDAASAPVYEMIRTGAKFELLIDNIKILVDTKKKWRSNINIKIDFTVMKDNFADLSNMVRIASDLKVDDILISPVNADFANDPKLKIDLLKFKRKELNCLARKCNTHIEYADYKGCFEPWVRPYITWDGFLTPCAVRPDPSEMNFGNVMENLFVDIWNNERFQQFRASPKKSELCRDCPRKWK